MRLGILATSYPTREDDAAGRFVEEMAEALAARGHSVTVLLPEHAERDHPPSHAVSLVPLAYARPRALERTFYGAGVPDNVAASPLLALPGLAYSARLALAARARRHAWDGVIAHFLLPSGAVAATLGRSRGGARGLPCLAVAHSADLHLLEKLPGRRTIARALDAGTRLWFVSEEARVRFEEVLGRPLRVEPLVSPMGVEALAPAPREEARLGLGLPAGDLVVASLARLVPVKGLDVAIDAIARVPGAVLAIGGEGPERDALASRAAARGARLRLLGPLGAEGKRALFGAADVFVVPSTTLASGRTEGIPVALLEALSAGLPAVASRVGGISARFAEEPGVTLVPERDPAALAEAIVRAARGARPVRPPAPCWDELAGTIEAALRDERRRSSAAAST